MRLRWTPAAAADLKQISDYLKKRYPHYRQPTMRKLYDGLQSLKEWPGRVKIRARGKVLASLPFSPLPYIVVYRVRERAIEVVRIYHGAQPRPVG